MSTTVDVEQAAIGIDLGGTATRFVALDTRGHVWSRFVVGTPETGSADMLGDFVVDRIVEAAAGREITSIGIGASGPIDTNGIIQNPATLPAFTGVDLLPNLNKAFGLKTEGHFVRRTVDTLKPAT
jgi:glucokinase